MCCNMSLKPAVADLELWTYLSIKRIIFYETVQPLRLSGHLVLLKDICVLKDFPGVCFLTFGKPDTVVCD